MVVTKKNNFMVEKNETIELEKDFYTTFDLIHEPSFPIRSVQTVMSLIRAGKLEAINISSNPGYNRFRISKKSVEEFLKNQNTFNDKVVVPQKIVKTKSSKKIKAKK